MAGGWPTPSHETGASRVRWLVRALVWATVAAALLALPAAALALAPPTNPSSSAGNTTATLNWVNPGTGDFTDTKIYRRTNPLAAWTLVRTEPSTDPTPQTWQDTGLTNLTDYHYAIRSFASGSSTELPIIDNGGLWTDYWQATDFTTNYKGRMLEGPVNWSTGSSPRPLLSSQSNFSARWTGYVYVDYGEIYTWYLSHDDAGQLWIDGTQIINSGCCGEQNVAQAMTVGWHTIEVDLVGNGTPQSVALSWSSPSVGAKTVIPADHLGHEHEEVVTPTDAGVGVTAPNGGENLTGLTTNITWNKTGTDTVTSWKLYYSTDGGATYPNFITGLPGASSSYTWSIPSSMYSTTIRVRVVGVSASGATIATDSSDADFTISTSPPAAVTSMHAVAGNGSVTVSWVNPTDPRFDHVQVWRSTVEGDPGTPVYTAPNAATTSWTDLTVANGTTYYYTVRSADSLGNVYVSISGMGLYQAQYSGSNFETYESLDRGQTITNDWSDQWYTATGSANTPLWWSWDYFSMRWYGMFWAEQAGTYTFSANFYDGARMYVDNSLVYQNWPNTNCNCNASGTIALSRGWHAIRQEFQEYTSYANIYSYVSGPGLVNQTIPASLTGMEPTGAATPTADTVTLVSPNGGSSLLGDRVTPITWTSTASAGTVRLRYSLDGGATYPFSIAASLPLNGTLDWSVPPTITSTQVRVLAELMSGTNGRPTARDTSDADFTVDSSPGPLPPAPTDVTARSGPAQVTVSWTNPSPLGTFDHAVVFRSTSDGDPGSIVYTAPNSGVTSWVDNTAVNGITYYYRVRGVDAAGRQSRNIIAGQVRRTAYSGSNFDTYGWTDITSSNITPDWSDQWYTALESDQYPNALWWDYFSVRWTGDLYIDNPGVYQLETDARDGGRLFVDGAKTVERWGGGDCTCPMGGKYYLTQGWHDITVEFSEYTSYAYIRLNYSGPGTGGRVNVPLAKLGYEPVAQATPTVDTVTVTSPNGGESWLGEATRTISWTSTALLGSMEIRYSTDGGAHYPIVIARNQPLNGSFTWSVPPNLVTANARIRVILRDPATNRPLSRDDSNADFNIDAFTASLPPAPTGLRTVAGAGQVTVSWTTPAPIGSYDHAVVYRSTDEHTPGTVVYTAPNSGVTSWVDNSVTNGTNYYYRVRGADAAGHESRRVMPGQVRRSVFSGSNFDTYLWTEILTSNITPDWSDQWYTGIQSGQYPGTLMWDYFSARYTGLIYIDTTGSYQMETDARDGGRAWVDGTNVSDRWGGGDCTCPYGGGVYLTQGWHDLVVDFGEYTSYAYIRLNYSGPGTGGRVNVPLAKLAYEPIEMATPTPDTVSVVTPNGGEVYSGESTVPITWTSPAGTGSVELRYSLDNGVTYPYVIAVGQPLNGTLAWSLPPTLTSANVRVRAILRSGVTNYPERWDDSDASFSVDSSPGPLPPAPTLVDVIAGNNQATVTWSNPSPAGTFDHAVVYRSTDQRSPGVPVYVAPNAAVTSWTDTSLANGTTYYYRVRGADASGRQGRNIVPGMVHQSVFSGTAFNTFLWSKVSPQNINYDWSDQWYTGIQSDQYPGTMMWDYFSVRWNATLYIDVAGTYQIETDARDGGRAWVDGVKTNESWSGGDCGCPSGGGVYLTQGWHDLVVEFEENTSYAYIHLNYSGPGVGRQTIPLAKLGYEPLKQVTPTVDTITLTSPNGGETWKGDATRAVSWNTTAAAGTVELRYSLDGGVTYPFVIAEGQPLNASFIWSIPPNVNSSQVRVRAYLRDPASNRPLSRDDSNGDFTIDTSLVPPPAPTALKANPGLASIALSWTNPSPIGTFDHAVIYRSTSEMSPGTVVYTAPNAGVTTWTDNTIATGVTYYYRVRGVDATGREGRSVTPGKLRLSYFSGSDLSGYQATETLAQAINYNWGSSTTVGPTPPGLAGLLKWDYFGLRWTGLLYIDTAGSYQLENDEADGSRTWIDGTKVADSWPSSNCGCPSGGGIYLTQGWHDLAVEYQETTGNAWIYLNYAGPGVGRQTVPIGKLGYEDVTTGRADGATISVTSPAGGATLTGQNASVAWTTTGLPVGGRIRLRVSTDAGTTWNVVSNDAGVSPFSWFLPRNTNSNTVRIRGEIVDPSGYVIARSDTPDFTVDTVSAGTITGLNLTPGWNQILVKWTNPGGAGYDHANIYRSLTPLSPGVLVQTVAAPGNSWNDTSVVNGTNYYYSVRAADAGDHEQVSVQSGQIRGEYWTGNQFDGVLKGVQANTTPINYDWGGGNPAIIGQADNWSIRWTGWIYFDQTTDWTIDQGDTADGSRIWIDNNRIVNDWPLCNCALWDTVRNVYTQGWHPITYEMDETSGNARAYLYYSRSGLGRTIVPISALGTEVQVVSSPTDTTPPIPNPNGQATPISATQINWSAPGASDPMGAGLDPNAYSFDGGTTWQASDTYARTGLTANTPYSQTVVVRDAANNQTTPKLVNSRTLALAPNVTADRPAGSWLGPAQATITFSNNAAWGAGGVQYYRYAWDTSPTYTWSDTETVWNAGTVAKTVVATGDYYLHVRSYNGDDLNSGSVDYGPYRFDLTGPTPDPATVTVVGGTTDVTFTVTGASDVGSGLHATAYSFDGGATWQASPVYSATGLGGNDSATRSVHVRDAVGNQTSVAVVSGTTQPLAPDVTPSPLPDAVWRVSGSVISLTSNLAFGPGTLWGYRYTVTQAPTGVVSGTDPAWTSGVLPVPLVGTSANWYIHVRSFNSAGVGGPTQDLGPWKIDATPPGPTGPVAAADPTNAAPQIDWTSVTDNESGLAGYKIYRSTSSGVLGSLVATQAGTSYTDPGPLLDGQRYFYTVQAYDNLGNEQLAGNTQVGVTYDSVTPTGALVSIAGGAASTNSAVVTLTLFSANATQMLIGNQPDLSDGVWEPYNVAKGWSLGAGDGTKTVYARFKSSNGTESATVSDTIVLDTTAPTPNPATGTATVTGATTITWNATSASDAGAGLDPTPYSFDGGTTWQASVSLNSTGLSPNTQYTKNVKLRDVLDNEGATGSITATTLPSAPGVTSVPAPDGVNTQPLGQQFDFTNTAGFGPGGVEYYRWAWDSSPGAYAFLGTEALWSSGVLSHVEWATGTYYLHVLAYNSDDVPDQQLTLGPYMVAPPTGSQTVHSNVGDTQTLTCDLTDFSVTLLPSLADDATIDCTVGSIIAGWNLQAHAASNPFFTEFADFTTTPSAWAMPGAGNAHVAFTVTGAHSYTDFANGTLWRGFAGTTDITVGGDTGTATNEHVITDIRAAIGAGTGLTPGPRSQTVTYTLSPGAPP